MDKRASGRGASPVAYLCGEDTCLPSLELFFKPNAEEEGDAHYASNTTISRIWSVRNALYLQDSIENSTIFTVLDSHSGSS
jgi:hypothetical protein